MNKIQQQISVNVKLIQIFINPNYTNNNFNKFRLTSMYTNSNYKKSYNDGKYNQNDIPTATKTNYLETSPYMNTPSLKSPNKIQSKIQGVRDSIGSMINQMSHKKHDNQEAVLRVRNINEEALNSLRGNDQYQTYTPKKSDRLNPRQNRTIGGAPDQQYNQGFSSQFNIQGDNVPQFKSLQQQNIQLRRALSEQVRFNQDLMARIRFLEAENYDLKTQLGYQDPNKLLRSTRYNSVSYDDTANDYSHYSPLSPSQPRYNPTSPRIASDNYIPNSYQGHQQRNTHAHGHNRTPSIGNNYGVNNNNNYGVGAQGYGSNTYIPGPGYAGGYNNNGIRNSGDTGSLLHELTLLKSQNQSLRQNAISLLKNQ